MLEPFKRLVDHEGGATAVEYGLIAALVSTAMVAALQGLGVSLEFLFDYITGVLDPHRCVVVGSSCNN